MHRPVKTSKTLRAILPGKSPRELVRLTQYLASMEDQSKAIATARYYTLVVERRAESYTTL